MDRFENKKSVRFSSPFEVEQRLRKTSSSRKKEVNTSSSQKHLGKQQPPNQNGSLLTKNYQNENDFDASLDSWNAFDEKMLRSKVAVTKVQNKFLELSSSQNKSLQLEDPDFSPFSFQDAQDIIEKDEKERLMFMNSNVSFSESRNEGIDQVDAPSLLSFTSYFQQGSSFPESLLMPRSKPVKEPEISSQAQRVEPISQNGNASRRTSAKRNSSSASYKNDSIFEADDNKTKKTTNLSREDSLARFFLGPESDGMGKTDIMEYVLDYCKRRASARLSDVSSIVSLGSPKKTNAAFENSSTLRDSSGKQDSGVEFGNEDKTMVSTNSNGAHVARTPPPLAVSNLGHEQVSKELLLDRHVTTPEMTHTPVRPPSKSIVQSINDKQESSVMLSEGGSMKDADGVLDVSDVGFEKFKKNLHFRSGTEDRYRSRTKHHAEFEKKRLNVDERFSHPRMSPKPFEGPGSTLTLERPNRNFIRNSPPEKLTRSRNEHTISAMNAATPSPPNVLMPTNAGSQCHSTPLNNEAYVSKLAVPSLMKMDTRQGEGKTKFSKTDNLKETVNTTEGVAENQKRLKTGANTTISNTSRHENRNPAHSGLPENFSKNSNFKGRTSVSHDSSSSKSDDVLQDTIGSKKTVVPPDPSNVLKPSNVPNSLTFMPAIQNALQQQAHINLGNPNPHSQCSCAHQYSNIGQNVCQSVPSTPGMMMPGVGMPIVIHIHLPCTMATTGTATHPAPSTNNPNGN